MFLSAGVMGGGRYLRTVVYLLWAVGISSRERCAQVHYITPFMVVGGMCGMLTCLCKYSPSFYRVAACLSKLQHVELLIHEADKLL